MCDAVPRAPVCVLTGQDVGECATGLLTTPAILLSLDAVAKDMKGIWPIRPKISKLPEGEEPEPPPSAKKDGKRARKKQKKLQTYLEGFAC